MKAKEGFIMREVAGTAVVLAVGKAADTFKGTVTLNGSGKLLWGALEKGATRDELIDLILEHYDTDREKAASGVDSFVSTLVENGIVEDE